MSSSVKLGGERLGSGKKNKYITKTFERSTHNLSYLWRSSMSAGTLVPFMSEVGLPGDTFDIELNADVKTLPTVGPLFGSYKVQLDIFEVPVRLFQGKLHMNKLELGREMNTVHLPQLEIEHDYKPTDIFDDNSQINPSCILSYLGIRGLGRTKNELAGDITRKFNAVPYLGYWSIFKNYYANKQEENAYVVHTTNEATTIYTTNKQYINGISIASTQTISAGNVVELKFGYDNEGRVGDIDPRVATVKYKSGNDTIATYFLDQLFEKFTYYTDENNRRWLGCSEFKGLDPADLNEITEWIADDWAQTSTITSRGDITELVEFPLTNIDEMTMDLITDVRNPTAYLIKDTTRAPYGLSLKKENGVYCKLGTQEGLALKTYQSDKFNNWIDTEWIDGTGGVSEVTRVATDADGAFTIDALSLANKVYKMLNRINMSGGSYNDWINAVYSHDSVKKTENPVYHGSLIKELAFEEVISTAESETSSNEHPLGTLAGRGKLTGKHKGGKMVVKCHEPCYVMGLVSITPRIDYSQGNKWDLNLKTLDDLHKPDLDQIGFQDLITDEMAWFDTEIDTANGNKVDYKSVGKVPAWLNYMTAVNQTRGNFAETNKEMFMTLNRRYEATGEIGTEGIKDITTYIDPSKFNHIFADTNLDSQNFWTQISVNNTARRKMSAKVIPNL
ncbi:major capsid protein [Microviridae sp.]|nr:major capsid protein [Microviridae sp.]